MPLQADVVRAGRDPDSLVGRARAVGLIAAGLAGCWLLSVALGGAAHIAPHWFYLPIMWAGMRFGRRGAALTASAALVIAGPLLPADVGTWAPQEVSDWVSRGVFFLGIGLVVAQLFVRLRQAGETDVQAAELRARLFAQARFQVLVETSSDVITVLGDDGSVVSRDGPVLAVFGDAAGSLAGGRLDELLHPDSSRSSSISSSRSSGLRPGRWTVIDVGGFLIKGVRGRLGGCLRSPTPIRSSSPGRRRICTT